MFKRFVAILLAAGVLAAASGPLCFAQDFYYDLDTTYGESNVSRDGET